MSNYSPEDIKRLLPYLAPHERELLRTFTNPQPEKHLLDFTCATYPGYKPEGFHATVARHLDMVVDGDIDRLIISAPPQHGKSELSSVRFPAFWLGRRPDEPLMISSYAASLAEDKSSQVRDIVESEEFAQIFKHVKTRDDSRAVAMWKLDGHRGYLRAAGVGGGLTGHGAKCGIIDDPVKDWEEAKSPTIREKVWSWYKTSFLNRIWPGGAIVIIMTRWDEDDLVGRILNSPGSERWTIVRLSAIAEHQEERDRNNDKYKLPAGLPDPLGRQPGEALCPELRPIEFLTDMKNETSSVEWNALYQGAPGVPDGNKIKREWLSNRIVDFVPVGPKIKRIRYWDKAATEGAGDYTVGVLMAYDPEEHKFYIEDVVRGQWDTHKRDKIMYNTAAKDFDKYGNTVTIWHEQEPGSSGKDVAVSIDQMLSEFPVMHEPATGSKELRFEPFVTACANGYVYICRAIWNTKYIDELCEFPVGRHDDQCDSTSGAYNKLNLAKKKRKVRVH